MKHVFVVKYTGPDTLKEAKKTAKALKKAHEKVFGVDSCDVVLALASTDILTVSIGE